MIPNQALCFYATIAGEKNLQSEITAQYEASLVQLATVCTDATYLRQSLRVSLPLFAVGSWQPVDLK